MSDQWITLNVGGQTFLTCKSTLCLKEPGSMLARMFASEEHAMKPSYQDSSGAFLIDRSPKYFEPVWQTLK